MGDRGRPHEKLQQAELARRELDDASSTIHLAGQSIELEILHAQALLSWLHRGACERPETRAINSARANGLLR